MIYILVNKLFGCLFADFYITEGNPVLWKCKEGSKLDLNNICQINPCNMIIFYLYSVTRTHILLVLYLCSILHELSCV